MKATLFFLIAFLSFGFGLEAQETTTVVATFDSYQDGTYYFSVEDREPYGFETIQEQASLKYDLTGSEFLGKKFKVTYIIEIETDEEDEEYDSYIITDLELIE